MKRHGYFSALLGPPSDGSIHLLQPPRRLFAPEPVAFDPSPTTEAEVANDALRPARATARQASEATTAAARFAPRGENGVPVPERPDDPRPATRSLEASQPGVTWTDDPRVARAAPSEPHPTPLSVPAPEPVAAAAGPGELVRATRRLPKTPVAQHSLVVSASTADAEELAPSPARAPRRGDRARPARTAASPRMPSVGSQKTPSLKIDAIEVTVVPRTETPVAAPPAAARRPVPPPLHAPGPGPWYGLGQR